MLKELSDEALFCHPQIDYLITRLEPKEKTEYIYGTAYDTELSVVLKLLEKDTIFGDTIRLSINRKNYYCFRLESGISIQLVSDI